MRDGLIGGSFVCVSAVVTVLFGLWIIPCQWETTAQVFPKTYRLLS